MEIKIVTFSHPIVLMGKAVKVFLKGRANDQAAFYFKVTGHELTHNPDEGVNYALVGFDDEGRELKIYGEDIDFITIGG